jgi:putative membrane protein
MKDYSKYFFITALALIIAAYFLAKVPISTEHAPISGLFIIALSLPCFYALGVSLGWKKALMLVLILSIYAIFIESFAIITGFPYSNFQYTDLIGFKLFGLTPYTLPFAYVPLFIGCFYLSSLQFTNKWKIIIFSTFLVLMADLVLDPAAVALKFWIFDTSGVFYGVPLMNFAGWLLSGFLASLIAMYLIKDNINDFHKPKAIVLSLFLILTFWSAVCAYMGLIIPAIVGIIFIVFILYKTNFKVGEFNKY